MKRNIAEYEVHPYRCPAHRVCMKPAEVAFVVHRKTLQKICLQEDKMMDLSEAQMFWRSMSSGFLCIAYQSQGIRQTTMD